LKAKNNLFGCNTAFSVNMSRFYFPQYWCFICQW